MSRHLQSILEKQNQLSNLQVVFLDIEKYSQRRTSNQVLIINEFTRCLNLTMQEIAQTYISFSQSNDYNFKNDTIIIPTGDGAAVGFTYEGLHNTHLNFAEFFLKVLNKHNTSSLTCEKFDVNGWCNCHNKFNVRIGISEGKAIIYKDINDNFNIAGNVINMAARVMNEANRNQIILTEEAYKQIIDLEEDPNFEDSFIELKNIKIKHQLYANIYIVKSEHSYINSELSPTLQLEDKLNVYVKKVAEMGKTLTGLGEANVLSSEAGRLQIMQAMGAIVNIMGDVEKKNSNTPDSTNDNANTQ